MTRVLAAVGTSLAIITTASVMGLAAHLFAGRDLDVGATVAMTAAGVAGGLGPRWRRTAGVLGRGFAGLLAAAGCYLLVSAAWLGGPPAS